MLPMNFCMSGSLSGSYSSMALNFRHSSCATCLMSLSSRHLASKSLPAKIFSSSVIVASSPACSRKNAARASRRCRLMPRLRQRNAMRERKAARKKESPTKQLRLHEALCASVGTYRNQIYNITY